MIRGLVLGSIRQFWQLYLVVVQNLVKLQNRKLYCSFHCVPLTLNMMQPRNAHQNTGSGQILGRVVRRPIALFDCHQADVATPSCVSDVLSICFQINMNMFWAPQLVFVGHIYYFSGDSGCPPDESPPP